MLLRRTMAISALLLLAGCEGEVPIRGDQAPANTIAGTVFLGTDLGGTTALPGPVIVFITDAANPMPPYGTGRPHSFAVIPPEDFSSGASGMPAAPYTLTGLPDAPASGWVVTALLDVDRNFHPLVDAFAGATCGDVVGAHVDSLSGGSMAPVSVSGGQRLDDVVVVLGQQLPTARPSFFFAADPVLVRSSQGGRLTVRRQDIHAELGPLALDLPSELGGEPCRGGFLVQVQDKNGDGLADPHSDFGLFGMLDISPAFALTFLGPVIEDGHGAPVIDTSAVSPGDVWQSVVHIDPQLYHSGALAPLGQPGLFEELDLVWIPAARHYTPDGQVSTVMDPAEIPEGAWALTVIQSTGQTWTVPNALAHSTSTRAGFSPTSQAVPVLIR